MSKFIGSYCEALFGHKHFHNKPIVSMYWTFHTRMIIYECKCGHRQSYKVTTPFGLPFPIPTDTLLTHKDFDKILAGAPFERVGGTIFLKKYLNA